MNLYKKTLLAVALTAAAFNVQASTVVVNTSTINLGTLATGSTTALSNGVSGLFADTFNFTLPANGGIGYGVAPLNLSFFNQKITNIDNFTASLFDSSNALINTGLNFSSGALAAGNYHIIVSGLANGLIGGAYAGGIYVSPVPEVETSSMMLLGLGLMGFIARRRSVK